MQHSAARSVRKLGTLERFRMILHDLGYHNNVAISARYTSAHPSPCSVRELVLTALRQAMQQHPALSVAVAERDEEPYFTPVPEVDLGKLCTFIHVPDKGEDRRRRVEVVLAEQHNIGCARDGSALWRVVVLMDDSASDDAGNVFDVVFV